MPLATKLTAHATPRVTSSTPTSVRTRGSGRAPSTSWGVGLRTARTTSAAATRPTSRYESSCASANAPPAKSTTATSSIVVGRNALPHGVPVWADW